MTSKRNWFVQYEELLEGRILMLGHGTEHPIASRCTVSVAMSNGEVKKFGNVLHVLILSKSLLSISKNVDAGMTVQFDSLQVVPIDIVLKVNVDAGDRVGKIVLWHHRSRHAVNLGITFNGSAKNALELMGHYDGDLVCDADQANGQWTVSERPKRYERASYRLWTNEIKRFNEQYRGSSEWHIRSSKQYTGASEWSTRTDEHRCYTIVQPLSTVICGFLTINSKYATLCLYQQVSFCFH
eukprot:Gb_33472 [translate_table: standard]